MSEDNLIKLYFLKDYILVIHSDGSEESIKKVFRWSLT